MTQFLPDQSKPLRVLCLGAHCDDLEIGCGGTLLKFFKKFQVEKVQWVVFSGNKERTLEAKKGARKFAADLPLEVKMLDFSDARFPQQMGEIKKTFESLKEFRPSLIFTHYEHDRHQDHRVINQLTWNTFRDHVILEYEIPKYDGDLGNPSCFVPISQDLVKQKIDFIMDCFPSQEDKHWFDRETFQSLMRLRGMECNSSTRYAEAFYVRKWKI